MGKHRGNTKGGKGNGGNAKGGKSAQAALDEFQSKEQAASALAGKLQASSAATSNVRYDPETDTTTIGKGQDEITIKPVDPTEKEDPACDMAVRIGALRILDAPPGTNSDAEMRAILQTKADEYDAMRLRKKYIGSLATLSRHTLPDGKHSYTANVTPLRETDGVSDLTLALYERDGTPVSADEYGYFVRINGRVFEQRHVGRTESPPVAAFPRVLPFKVFQFCGAAVDLLVEPSLAARFCDIRWELEFSGYCFGNPAARFAASPSTWGYLSTTVDGKDCVFEFRGATANFLVGTWAEVQARRQAAEAAQQKEAKEKAARENPQGPEAELDRMFA